MKEVKPLVSIVLCTYNGAAFLEAQLKSILEQTYRDFELIICDDASTDNTPGLINNFAATDPRIRAFFNKENKGVNKNFEMALRHATEDFIAIADQDDVWKNDKIEKLLALMTPGTILVHGASVNFSGNDLPLHKKYEAAFIPLTGNDPRKLLLRNSVSGHSMLFKKELLQHCLPVPATLYYDWWIIEVAICTGNIEATKEVLTWHRIHDTNFAAAYKKNTKKQTREEYEERKKALAAFMTIEAMPAYGKLFLQRLSAKYATLENRKFSLPLFLFLLRHSSTLFFYKKKLLPWFSYIKTGYRFSFAL